MKPLAFVGAALVFGALATLNTAGYRYGASDQAFYIPAIVQHLHPDYFPRDRALIEAQSRIIPLDDVVAAIVSATGVSVPVLFFTLYVGTLLLLAVGAMLVGGTLYSSPWSTAALLAALTLRHRIPRTGVNTLEGYFHPRMLAFAIGILGVAALLRGRSWLALSLILPIALIDPTTAVWFAMLLGVAAMVSDTRMRWPAVAMVSGLGVGLWMLVGTTHASPIWGGERLVKMDADWLIPLSGKDYLFPTDWPWWAWVENFGYVGVMLAGWRARHRLGRAVPEETGLLAGGLTLFVFFALSLFFIAAKIALAVEMQTSRVFWLLDFLAIAYAVWLVCELRPVPGLPRTVALVMIGVAAGRGVYSNFVEHPERRIIELNLPSNDWEDTMAWIRQTPPQTHVLADSGHAWRYGSSVRVSGERDVFLEEVKDAAIALYSRDVAMRVLTRIPEVANFNNLTPAAARDLASRYDLDLLVTTERLDLPLAFERGRFAVYRLK